MDWKELLSLENIQFIGTVCGAIIATAYASFRTFKAKLDKEFKGRKVDVSKNISRQSNTDYEIIKETSHLNVIKEKLRVMDLTAISLCMDNNIPIRIFNLNNLDNLKKALLGEDIGTIIK